MICRFHFQINARRNNNTKKKKNKTKFTNVSIYLTSKYWKKCLIRSRTNVVKIEQIGTYGLYYDSTTMLRRTTRCWPLSTSGHVYCIHLRLPLRLSGTTWKRNEWDSAIKKMCYVLYLGNRYQCWVHSFRIMHGLSLNIITKAHRPE
jgi:hypothetical protein